jgi:P-type Cu+ transporter
LLWLLGSLERNSEHPLALAVVTYSETEIATYLHDNPFRQPKNFQAFTGRGASGKIDGVMVAVGNRSFCSIQDISISSEVEAQMSTLEQDGKTAILAAIDGKIAGVMGIADELKSDAACALAYLQSHMGVEVWMVTGDNSRTARAISMQLGLAPDNVISEALPVDKVQQVKKLQAQGKIVAMIGDGINDSPALAQANVGMSLGTGAEIAAEAADMVLVRGNVADVCTALDLSRVMFRRIQLNLFFSLVYNCLGIPVAAGVFYPFIRTRLPPTLAAVAMALSSLSVVSSSLALRLYVPPKVETRRNESLFQQVKRQVWVVPASAVSNYGDATPTRENDNDLTQPLLLLGAIGVDDTATAVAMEEGGFKN